jgi:hypothetical protein
LATLHGLKTARRLAFDEVCDDQLGRTLLESGEATDDKLFTLAFVLVKLEVTKEVDQGSWYLPFLSITEKVQDRNFQSFTSTLWQVRKALLEQIDTQRFNLAHDANTSIIRI